MKRKIIYLLSGFVLMCIISVLYILFIFRSNSVDLTDALKVSKIAKFKEYTVDDFTKHNILDNRLNVYDFEEKENIISLPKRYEFKEKVKNFNGIDIPVLQHSGINEDYIGRLSIPSLAIEDSLYYTGDDYYLRTSHKGKYNVAGELYIDGRSSGDLFKKDNLINGHSMTNGTKFGNLLNIIKSEFPVYIFISDYSSSKIFIYEVFSVNLVSNKNSGIYLSFGSMYERNLYYEKLVQTSQISTELNNFSDNILTLNTCDNNINEGHLIVSAILKGWQ